jgi:Reverse transcriptase (RNA-dependent DNA polymerase)
MIENYNFKYRTRGKFIFVPNESCKRKGLRIIKFFSRLDLPEYFFHYRKGGHVAALHQHLKHKFFFKIDIQNFFYSIARMRVTRALRHWGYPGAGTVAKWSCVANPYGGPPPHVLPIGFLQSPLLASLVLMRSPVTEAIERARAKGVFVSVYLDDFIGSHDDEAVLGEAFEDIRQTCIGAELVPNATKLVAPTQEITAFNCDLVQGLTMVTPDRIARFYSTVHTPRSQQSFEEYLARVESANG